MVGMFGFGAEAGNGYWKLVGTYPWDNEPDWEAVEKSAYPEDEEGDQ
jgi:hypothetical protein